MPDASVVVVTYNALPWIEQSIESVQDEEVVVVLKGILDLWVADEHYVLREGDALTFSSRLPHWNANHGDVPVSVLFCLTPPSF